MISKRICKVLIASMLAFVGAGLWAQNNISGTVLDVSSNPVANVAISVIDSTGATVEKETTDAFGDYIIYGLVDDAYSIIPQLAGFDFEPTSLSVTVSGQNVADQDFVASNVGISSPTEITGCQLWLDGADPRGDGNPLDGELTVWVDKSGNDNNATQSSSNDKAFVLTDALNGKSVVNMPVGDAYFKFSTVHSRTLFWVIKEGTGALDAYDSRAFMGFSDDYPFTRGVTPNADGTRNIPDGKIWDELYAIDEVKYGGTYLDGQAVDGTTTVFPNNSFHMLSLVTSVPNGSTGVVDCNQLTQTQNSIDSSWKGQIAEVIIYDQPLSDRERELVEQYLRNKWFAPVANDDEYVNASDSSLIVNVTNGVLANDTTNLNVTLTATVISQPLNGSINLNTNGSFTYNPNVGFIGTDTFTYKASDGDNLSNLATVTITVKDPANNSAPVANDDYYTMYGASPLYVHTPNGVLVNDTDADYDAFNVNLDTNVQNGTLVLNSDGSFSYTPNLGWSGTETFTYVAFDGIADSNIATVTIEVYTKLDYPTSISGCTLWLDGADPNGDGSVASGEIEWWVNKADNEKSCFQPNVANQAIVVADALNGNSVMNFASDGEHTYSVWDLNANAGVQITGQTYFWVVKEIDNGTTDPHFFLGDYYDSPFHRGIGDVNNGYAADGTYWDNDYAAPEVRNGKTYLDGNLIDGITSVFPVGEYHIVSLVATGPVQFNQISQDRSGYGSRSWVGDIAEIITYDTALSDGDRQSVESYLQDKWVEAAILPKDDLYTVEINQELSVPVPGVMENDKGNNISATLVDDVSNGILTFDAGGSFVYNPNTDFIGTDIFTYTVTDGVDISNIATVTIEVKDPSTNHPPVAVDDSYSIGQTETLTTEAPGILENDSDLDHDFFHAVLIDDVSHGTLTLNSDGSFEYIPEADTTGVDTFTYVANDGLFDSNVATVSINVIGSLKKPTDIIGCALWLDGSDPKGDGTEVTGKLDGWINKADASNIAYQVYEYKQAEVIADALNGRSVVSFADGEQTYPIVNTAALEQQVKITTNTVFWVIKENATLVEDSTPFFLGDSENTPFHRGIDSSLNFIFDGKYWDDEYAASEVRNGQTYLDGQAINGTQQIFPVDEYHVVSVVLTGPVEIDQISQDRDFMGPRSWQGDIAEIIIYNQALSDGTRKAVETYLYDKWFGSPTFTVSGTVTDANSNPLEGVKVVIDDENWAVTDTDGKYSIIGLVNGTYTLTPDTYTFAPASTVVTIADANATVDFTSTDAVATTYTISGTVLLFNDQGSAIEGVAIADDKGHSTVSDVDGKYSLLDLVAGDYTITATLDGYTFTSTVQMPVTILNVDLTNIDFTGSPILSPGNSISGKILDAQSVGIENVIISIDASHTATTDVDGQYTITNLEDGQYTVTPVLGGYIFDPLNANVTLAGADVTDVDFSASVKSGEFAISGTVLDENGDPLENVEITADAAHTATTDVDGNYTITNLPAGTYDMTAEYTSPYVFTPSVEMPLELVDKDLEVNFTSAPVSITISGAVFNELGVGLENVLVTIDDTHTAITDADGHYFIGDFPDGTYTVTPSKEGYAFEPGSQEVEIDRFSVSGVNFRANTQKGDYSISGIITDETGKGLAYVLVSVDSVRTTTTDADGNYTIGELKDGTYNVTPVLADYIFSPAKLTVVVADADIVDQNFTAIVNTTPVAVDDPFFSVTEGTTLNVPAPGVIANDSYSLGDGIAMIRINPEKGTVTLNEDGSFIYTPNTGETGVDSFKYFVKDAKGALSNEATALITINPQGVNNKPVALDDKYVTVIDTALTVDADGILANDFDVDGNDLSAVLVNNVQHGTLTLNSDGSFTYTSNTGFTGTDSFTYTVNDGTDDGNVATVKISVSRPIVTHNISGQIIDVTGKPIEGVTVSVDVAHSTVSDASGGYIITDLIDGTYTLTPVKDAYTFKPTNQNVTIEGADITVSEFTGTLSESQEYMLKVNNGTGGGQYAENVEVPISATVPAGKVFDAWTGDVQYLADLKTPSTTVTMPVNDVTITATFKVAIVGTYNISGTITDEDGNGLEDVVVSIDAVRSGTTDADGKYIINEFLNGTYELTPVLDGYSFTPVKLSVVIDGSDMPEQNFTAFVNASPIAVDDTFFSVSEGTTLTVPAPGILTNDSDPEGDSITAIIGTNTTKGTVILNQDGLFTYTPNTGETGEDTFTYFVKDDKGALSNEATVIITINTQGVNNVPVALDDKYLTLVDTELVVPPTGILANDFDVDEDTLTVVLPVVSQPVNGTLTVKKDGSFVYTPNSGFEGDDSFSYTANDGTDNSNIATVKISINAPTGQPPVANNEEYQIESGAKLTISASGVLGNDTDPDGDKLIAKLADDVKNGNLTLNPDGSFTYTSDNEFVGKDSFTYLAFDGTLESNLATVSIEVTFQKVTLGTPVSVSPRQAHLLIGETFDKGKAKIYGVLDGKNLNLKKDKSSTETLVKGTWAKKYALYDKKDVKSGYAAAIDNQHQAIDVPLTVKGKSNGTTFENQAQSVTLVPPVITSVRVSGTTITIVGKYFGIKEPKVALEPFAGGKLVKCKVDKKSYHFDPTEKGDTTITATYKAKKAPAGIYRLVLDNKIGIGVETNKKGKEVLPTVQISGN